VIVEICAVLLFITDQ